MADPTATELYSALRRAADSLSDLIRDHSDPGAEALGAVYEVRSLLARNVRLPRDDEHQPVMVPELAKVEDVDGAPLPDDVQEQVREIVAGELEPALRLLREARDFRGFAEWRPGVHARIEEYLARHV